MVNLKQRSDSPLLYLPPLMTQPKSPSQPKTPSSAGSPLQQSSPLAHKVDSKISHENMESAIDGSRYTSPPPPSTLSSNPLGLDNEISPRTDDLLSHQKSNSNLFMKKASSMTNIKAEDSPSALRSQTHSSKENLLLADAANKLVNSCNKYLDQNNRTGRSVTTGTGGTIDIKIERVCSLPEGDTAEKRENSNVRFIPVVLEEDYYSNNRNKSSGTSSLVDPKRDSQFNSEKHSQSFDRGSASYGTLPHVLRKQQKHMRSLIVPKMRRMFEKSKSAEPEGPSRMVKLKIQIDPPKSPSSNQRKEIAHTPKDGTESVSSFVAVNKNLLDVVDGKRKKLARDLQGSESFSSNGDEWSLSEAYDQTPSDEGETTDSNSLSKKDSATVPSQHFSPNGAISKQYPSIDYNRSKEPANNGEIFTDIPVDCNNGGSNENNANVLNNKSFVNKCVSKVKNLVNSKQGSPQPGQ